MRCLIVAAGRGSRLAHRGESKPLTPLLGVALIERVIRAAQAAGITRFCVVTGHEGARLHRFLAGLAPRLGVTIDCVDHPGWTRGNGSSVLAGRACVGDAPFLLLMADHIVDERILRALRAATPPEGGVVLAVDHDLANPLVDPADVTRVRTRDGRIVAIGKGLEGHDGFDTGAFLCTPGLFAALEAAAAEGGELSLTAAVRRLAGQRRALALDVRRDAGADVLWIDVDDEAAYRRAEAALLARLRGKAHDGPVSRWLNRPLSIRLSRWLVRTPLTPNAISLASFGLSCLAALLMSRPGYAALAGGGLLAQLASVLDGCDGEVARLRHQESEFGGWFDAVLDRYADAFLLAGMTWHGFAADGGGAAVLAAGLLAITGSFALSYTADKYDGLMRARIGRGSRWRIGRDLRVLAVMVGALLHAPLATLTAIAAVMNAEVARRVLVAYRAAP